MKRSWSPAAEQKLRALYGREPVARISFLLKRTETAVKSRAKLLGLQSGRRHIWTPAEDKVLRARFPHEKTASVAKDLGLDTQQLFVRARRLGLSKTAKYLASPDACRLRRGEHVGKAFQFPKGHVPANKGLRRPGYAPGRMASTQFKKGQAPHNGRLPIGAIRLNADGYYEKKIASDRVGALNYRALHRILWEDANGPVPPGHVVAFKDGEKLNCVLENLELMTMADNARRNVMWRKMPKELASILALRAAVQRQINKRDPRAKEETHERRKAARRALRNALRTARQRKPDGARASEGGRAGR
jgi:hypothetical protein